MQRVRAFVGKHRRFFSVLVGLFVAVLGFLAIGFLADRMLATSGAPACPEQQSGDIRTGQNPKWALKADADDNLLLALDHQVNDSRRDQMSVTVTTLDGAKTAELPADALVGARLKRTPRAAEPLAFDVITSGKPSDDGQSILVEACTKRPDRDTKPGRYVAPVRVGGAGIVPAEVPVEVTIRAGVKSTLLIALLAAILGLALTHYGSPVQTARTGTSRHVVVALAVVTGLIGGLAAAYLAYDADPTWGAHRGKDTVELFIATVAASSAAMSAAGAGAKVFDAVRLK